MSQEPPVELVRECRALADRLRGLVERAERVDAEIARHKFDRALARSVAGAGDGLMGLQLVQPTIILPECWRMSPVAAEGGCEARRLVQDEHAFGGLAVQGTEEQCLNAAWVIETFGPDNLFPSLGVVPLRRQPLRGLTADRASRAVV